MRAALLLCALLLLAGCSVEAQSSRPAWTTEEAAYLNAIVPSINALPLALMTASAQEATDSDRDALKQATDALQSRPATPATLAVIGLLTTYLIVDCRGGVPYTILTPVSEQLETFKECGQRASELRLEIARLYAARGSYPPGLEP